MSNAGAWVGKGSYTHCRVCHRHTCEHPETPCRADLVGITETVANADVVAQWPTMCPPRIEKTYMYRTDRPNSRGRTYFFNSGQILSWGDFSSLTWVDDAWVAAWLARATHTFDLESSHAPLSVV